jgi:hypothetical protein
MGTSPEEALELDKSVGPSGAAANIQLFYHTVSKFLGLAADAPTTVYNNGKLDFDDPADIPRTR